MNFAKIWLARVIELLINSNAPWLDGIAEIPTPPITLGEGTLTEKNVVYLPESIFEPEVLVNNSTYPLGIQNFDDGTQELVLNKFQTKATSVSDDEIMGSSYDKIDGVTKSHLAVINREKYSMALHALAPTEHTANTPVLKTTGDADPTGRKRLIYEDLVAFSKALDEAGTPMEGRRLVLCADHFADMLLDRKNFGSTFVDYKAGTVLDVVNFKVYKELKAPYFTSAGVKLPYGAIPGASDKRASVCFWEGNVGKKSGLTKQYFTPATMDTQTQSNLLNYRHYFVAMPIQYKHIGAIVSGS
jgi:hypothetical protein